MKNNSRAPFRAWDGEGVTRPNDFDVPHRFVLLATNDAHIYRADGIGTKEALRFLLQPRARCINLWYYFDYDVNCILRDIPLYAQKKRSGSLEELAETGETRWCGYRLRYIPNKIFSVQREHRFDSYDLSGFFQKSFVSACKSFGLDTSAIEAGKRERSNFWSWAVEDIIAYNQGELDLLTSLAESLRARLTNHAPKRLWYGPGAVATQYLRQKKINNAPIYPAEMQDAVLRAYFGGRIDAKTIGEIEDCYLYDIASAYPYAITHIPYVEAWAHNDTPSEIAPFALYRVRWSVETNHWGPFPWRSKDGYILFPENGEGWYFGVEVSSALKLFPSGIEILEAWVPTIDGTYPLRDVIREMYATRKELKDRGDKAELAYKLIPNSCYGKFAQKAMRVEEGEIIRPPFQNYAWAGFTTAFTRAMLLDVIAKAPSKVICVATDSIFSTAPVLPTKSNGALGSWTYEGCYATLLVMPGVYARFLKDGSIEKVRQRGFPSALNYGAILRRWGCSTKRNTPGDEHTQARIQNFITFRVAVAQKRKDWCYFEHVEKAFNNTSIFGFSKRFPDPSQLLDGRWKARRMLPTPRRKGSEMLSAAYKIPTLEQETKRDYKEIILL